MGYRYNRYSDSSFDALAFIGLIIFAAVVILLAILSFTAVGIFTGWLVSITPLGAFVEDGFLALGFNVKGLLPQIGGAIGFISGFFTGIRMNKNNKD